MTSRRLQAQAVVDLNGWGASAKQQSWLAVMRLAWRSLGMFYIFFLLRVVVDSKKPKKKTGKAAGPEAPPIPYDASKKTKIGQENIYDWQESRRYANKKCEKERAFLFTRRGKLVERSLEDIQNLMKGIAVDAEMDGEFATMSKLKDAIESEEAGVKTTTTRKPVKTTTPKPLTKKEKRKQKLEQMIGGVFGDPVAAKAAHAKKERDEKVKSFESTSQQFFGQLIAKTKLPKDQKLTLSEFCDVLYRQINPTPLDLTADEIPDSDPNKKYMQSDDPFEVMEAETKWWEENSEDSETDMDDEEL